MKWLQNRQQVLFIVLGVAIGLGLDYFVGGYPFKTVVLILGLGVSTLFFLLPHIWPKEWKVMRIVSISSLILLGLTWFDAFVVTEVSWVSVGLWSTLFIYSSYQWWILRALKRKNMSRVKSL